MAFTKRAAVMMLSLVFTLLLGGVSAHANEPLDQTVTYGLCHESAAQPLTIYNDLEEALWVSPRLDSNRSKIEHTRDNIEVWLNGTLLEPNTDLILERSTLPLRVTLVGRNGSFIPFVDYSWMRWVLNLHLPTYLVFDYVPEPHQTNLNIFDDIVLLQLYDEANYTYTFHWRKWVGVELHYHYRHCNEST